MRAQTKVNRYLGLNAGRERREATSNREAISQTRRGEVFRQDVEHSGNARDPIRTRQQDTRAAKLDAAEPTILTMRAAGATYQQMREATGISQQYLAAILARNGLIRRQPARLRKW